ncbi:MAG: hypothetical protein MI810_00615 [Flavobacteriales bacterium]|nr:hypothetical protein [Flavobacteriales bacterium]
MKKNILWLLTGLFLLSCGGETNDKSEASEESTEVAEENATDHELDEEISEAGDEDIDDSDAWQIDDYAELLLKSDVYSEEEKDKLYEEKNYDILWYETLDKKGGFARVVGPFEGAYTYCLWRMADGSDLIGETTIGCGPVCDYSAQFFKQNKSEGKEVSQTILPNEEMDAHRDEIIAKVKEKHDLEYPEDVQYIFELPQKGTSMTVQISIGANELEFPLLELSWDKEKFSIAKKFNEIP